MCIIKLKSNFYIFPVILTWLKMLIFRRILICKSSYFCQVQFIKNWCNEGKQQDINSAIGDVSRFWSKLKSFLLSDLYLINDFWIEILINFDIIKKFLKNRIIVKTYMSLIGFSTDSIRNSFSFKSRRFEGFEIGSIRQCTHTDKMNQIRTPLNSQCWKVFIKCSQTRIKNL